MTFRPSRVPLAAFSALLWIVVGARSDAIAATRYASPTGTGTTCTQGQPCTLAQAVAIAVCGDLVTAADGTYGGVAIQVTKSCTAANRLVIQSTNLRKAILTTVDVNGAFYLKSTANYVSIRNFLIVAQAGADYGVRSFSGGSGLRFEGLEIDTLDAGISIAGGSDNVIDGVLVYHHDPDGYAGNNDGSGCFPIGWDGMTTSNITIKNSTCKDIWLFGGQKNVLGLTVQDNVLQNIHDHGIMLMDCNNVMIQRNRYFVTRTNLSGTWAGSLFDAYCSSNVTARNNSIYSKNVQVTGYNIMPNLAQQCTDGGGPDNSGGNRHHVWVNNIVSKTWQDCIRGGQSCVSGDCMKDSYSIYNQCGTNVSVWNGSSYPTLAAWQAANINGNGVTQCVGCKSSDPLFAAPDSGDLTLRPGSPAIDAGDDANCANAILGAHCDMGAFEGAATPPGNVTGLVRTDQH